MTPKPNQNNVIEYGGALRRYFDLTFVKSLTETNKCKGGLKHG